MMQKPARKTYKPMRETSRCLEPTCQRYTSRGRKPTIFLCQRMRRADAPADITLPLVLETPAGYRSSTMHQIRRPTRGTSVRGAAALGALLLAVMLAGCATPLLGAGTAADGTGTGGTGSGGTAVVDTALGFGGPDYPRYDGVTVTPDVAYAPGQLLDVCEPQGAADAQRRAVIVVHGGSWRQGDKADPAWRSACEWLASEGFVAFSLNYSLAPAAPFPAGIDDVRSAVAWLREPAQLAAYGHDAAHIGALGGSAGGNLVALLGATGEGPLDTGSRVAAVVDLSGPIDLGETGLSLGTPPAGFDRVQLDYLGCASYADCAAAASASPQRHLDAGDPPVLIAHSSTEYIPLEQSTMFADALRAARVPVTLIEVPGTAHSVAMLGPAGSPLRATIVEFLRASLA